MTELAAPSPSPGTGPAFAPTLERALSHAVRTPLHSLMGFLELLAMSGLDEDQRRLQERLAESAEELLQGSDRVLWLIRLLGGHYQARPARVFLSAFAAEVAAASEGTVSAVLAPDAPPHVDTDVAALHQLVGELVTNAVRHGAAPVVLAITAAGPTPGALRITVSDGGTGASPAARRALSDAVAGDAPTGRLGLLLVRRLADLLGAHLEVPPTPVGTHVTVTMPGSVAPHRSLAPVSGPPAGEPGSAGRPLRVLLVEDNATNRLLTERQLSRLGHSLTAVATGRAGISAALDPDIDLVLMDRHLPDIDGCAVTEQIRAARPAGRPHLPVIGVTADATRESHDACAAAGMDEVLTKPVDLDALSAALRRAVAAIAGTGGSPGAPAGTPARPGRSEPGAYRATVQRLGGDERAAAELMAVYLGELPGRRLRIQASLRRGEARAVLAAAESLRTSSEAVGAQAVVGSCAALAAAAAADDLMTARAFLPSLMAHCEQFASQLTEHAGLERAVLDGRWTPAPG